MCGLARKGDELLFLSLLKIRSGVRSPVVALYSNPEVHTNVAGAAPGRFELTDAHANRPKYQLVSSL